MTKPVHFNILARDSQSPARLGQLDLPHGSVQTPIFMPVGTYGTVKAMTPRDLNEAKAQIILGNTFHLWLRPGLDVIQKHGGLHRFMGWDKPILTDSGGFQVFSLGALRKISEEGVTFASPINGDKLFMSPEVSMEIQAVLNSDIAMQFDECTPYEIKGQPTSEKTARTSLEMSLRWGDRSLKRFRELNTGNGLFGIVQGGMFENLREFSLDAVSQQGFDGIAIGGLSVGEPKPEFERILNFTAPKLPEHMPHYLMGVGTPEDLILGVSLGIDMFDCVMPTRNGRNGMLFTAEGFINIKNKKWEKDFSPLDPGIPNELSQYYTKSYMRHLFVADEILGLQLASIQNLSFYLWLVGEARKHIVAGDYSSWKVAMIEQVKTRL